MNKFVQTPDRMRTEYVTTSRRHHISALVLMLAGLMGVSAHAQLLHRYQFVSGNANDTVGTANGTLEGAATISGGALNANGTSGTLSGGVPSNGVMLPAAAVSGITNAFAIETWFNANYVGGGYSTLFAFSANNTANYVLATPARGNWPYPSGAAIIGGGGNTSEQQAGGIYLDNGSGPHDMVINYDGTNVTYYLDGSLATDDPISHVQQTFVDTGLNLSTLTYIGIAGGSPWPDNSMNGQTYDFRIFGQSLSAAQVAAIHAMGTNASNSALATALIPPSAFTWNGGGADNNWGTGLNWIGGAAPAVSGNNATFAGSTRTSPTMNANYSLTGLTFSNNASSFTLGTVNNSLTLAGDLINNSASAQTLSVPVSLGAAINFNAAAGNLVVNSNITLGVNSLNLTGTNNFTLNGNITGTGSLSMNGTGSLTLGGANVSVGALTFNNGTANFSDTITSSGGTMNIGHLTGNGVVNMSGGVMNQNGEIRVGGSDQNGSSVVGTGVFNVTGGTVNAGSLTLARGNYLDNNVSGTVTLNSGSTMISSNDVILQFAGQGHGQLALNGGNFIIGPTALKWFQIGFYDSGSGELDITNGNLLLENSSSMKLCRSGNTGGDVVNQLGGTVTFYGDAGVTVGGSGNLDMNYAGGSSSTTTYNLNGGTLTVPQIVASSVNGSSTFNFNGGTLKPAASSSAFMQGLTAANVLVGGAKIDTTNLNVSIGQTLLNGDGLGGGLTKLGSGTLSLAGGYTFTGPLTVQAGTVALDASQTSSGGNVVANNSALSLSLNNGSSSILFGNLTLTGSSALSLNFGTATSPTATALSGSSVTVTGTNVINITGQYLVVGQYPLIYTGGSTPTNNFKLGTLPVGMLATLTNSGTSLDLLVTGTGQNLIWYGADASGNPLTAWNINSSANWNTGAAKYLQYSGNSYGDNVTFDDTLFTAADANITLGSTVVPASVTFNNSSTAYSVTGSGGIGGATAVAMNGAGVTYLGTTNTYTGGTTVQAGTLSAVNDKALGAAAAPVTLAGGTLQFSNSTTSARSISVVSNSTLSLTANVVLTGNLSGPGTLTATGPGTLTLAGAGNAQAILLGTGALNLTGGATNVSTTVGGVAGNATMNISGALVSSNLFVGDVSGAFAAVTQTGGTVILNGGTGDNLSIGNWTGSYGYFNAAGGTMNVNGINIGGEQNPNVWPPAGSGDGILEVNGATINNIGWIVLARGGGPNTGILNMFSGSLTYAGGGLSGNWELTANGDQTSIVNLLGGSITSTSQGVSFRTTDTGIVNLNGGLLQGTSVTGPGVVNFSGGTLRPSLGFANPFLNVSDAFVFAGGAKLDDNGQSVTLSQALHAPAGYGVSSVVLSDGGSAYIAPPIVKLSGGNGSNATVIAQINLATGTITNVLVTCPGSGYSSGDAVTATFSGGGSTAVAPATATVNLAANTSGGLTKLGAGTVTVDAVNTYTGPTVISAGTLAGTGTIAGPLTNNATLAPGDSGSGALTVSGNLTLGAASTNTFAVNGSTPANASVVAGGNVTYGGVLKIAPSGTFTVGQQFTLFSGAGATSASHFASISGSAGSGLGFTFTNGVLSVVATLANNPTNLLFSVSGGTMSLSWPSDHLGWILQQQTNRLTAGLGTNWVDVTGTAGVTSTNISINPASPTVFFRLRHP